MLLLCKRGLQENSPKDQKWRRKWPSYRKSGNFPTFGLRTIFRAPENTKGAPGHVAPICAAPGSQIARHASPRPTGGWRQPIRLRHVERRSGAALTAPGLPRQSRGPTWLRPPTGRATRGKVTRGSQLLYTCSRAPESNIWAHESCQKHNFMCFWSVFHAESVSHVRLACKRTWHTKIGATSRWPCSQASQRFGSWQIRLNSCFANLVKAGALHSWSAGQADSHGCVPNHVHCFSLCKIWSTDILLCIVRFLSNKGFCFSFNVITWLILGTLVLSPSSEQPTHMGDHPSAYVVGRMRLDRHIWFL